MSSSDPLSSELEPFFNAFHAPIGAHASFTLGCRGASGGLGLERGGPAGDNVWIGLETREGGAYEALPFFDGSESDEAARYDHANSGANRKRRLAAFTSSRIHRAFGLGTDSWSAGDLTFTLFSPVEPAPDPERSSRADQKRVYCPAVTGELVVDNRDCTRERLAFVGFQCPWDRPDVMRWWESGTLKAVFHGQQVGMATDADRAECGTAFDAERLLGETHLDNIHGGLGGAGMLLFRVPAGTRKTFRLAFCFFRGGQVTTGIAASYWYSRFFGSVEDVARFALEEFPSIRRRAKDGDRLLRHRGLTDAQRFHLIHAIRSYYGSTQLLEHDGKPIWVVNEGEYRMMNTFDLTVDQLFYEMRLNPWTVRNELDLFTQRYSYTDKLHAPGEANDKPGGLSFTHDMGCRNHFSRPGYSSYERTGLTGCFSYMTHEQLVNWVLCATVYVEGSGDREWLRGNLTTFRKCLSSMMNRDATRDTDRNGIMSLDSDRTRDGAEITTYDSLDASLGQARNNVYLGVKSWAAYLALEHVFAAEGLDREAGRAAKQAARAALTLSSHLNEEGFIPAVLGEGCEARIIPAIEGLVFPPRTGRADALDPDGPYGHLIRALRTHFDTVFRPGVCLYDDGGWKLSSSVDNSWLSKIYLCQYVARDILGIRTPATGEVADRAHRAWLLKPENRLYAWSDQMTSGVAKGSKYYPRGVTAILWLEERASPFPPPKNRSKHKPSL